MLLWLISPYTHQAVAELAPQAQVVIFDPKMRQALESSGITVTPEFKKLHNTKGCHLFPSEDKKIFALAFEQFYFKHGLQQQGYYWQDKSQANLSAEALALQLLKC